ENHPAGRVDARADVAEVRVRDVLDLGQRRTGQPDERGAPIGALVDVGQRLFGRARGDTHVDGREDAAIDRDQVRREGDLASHPLLDLGAVAVVEYAVRGEAAVDLREVRALRRRLAGARY